MCFDEDWRGTGEMRTCDMQGGRDGRPIYRQWGRRQGPQQQRRLGAGAPQMHICRLHGTSVKMLQRLHIMIQTLQTDMVSLSATDMNVVMYADMTCRHIGIVAIVERVDTSWRGGLLCPMDG